MNDVGDGTLTMGTIVQQPYAGAEHNRTYYKHPRGGIARWLSIGVVADADHFMRIIAFSAVTPNGSNIKIAAIDVSERMAGITKRMAPVMTGLLRDSADAYVYDAGQTIYYREAGGPYNYDKE